MQRTDFDRWSCPTQKAVELIGDKWTLFVVREFIFGKPTMGFNEILRVLKPISSRTLALKLHKLEQYQMVRKEIIQKKPLRIHYHITEKGLALKNCMVDLAQWYNENSKPLNVYKLSR